MFGANKIEKTILIEGMSCMHCAKKVEGVLKELKPVKGVTVDLENKKATLILKENIEDSILKECIEDLGYEVKEIK